MMIKFSHSNQVTNVNSDPFNLVCPHCGQLGTFVHLQSLKCEAGNVYSNVISIQRCPNQECRGVLIGLVDYENDLHLTFPGLGRPVNTDNVPQPITDAFQESVSCFANNCYVAAAIMLRKTLEEICSDKGAKGGNLFHRLTNLTSVVVIPPALSAAMQDLRLLGNDAAHIESKTYNQVGREELELSIDFTQEIIKAIYQYDDLLARLQSLKAPSTPPATA